MTMQRRSFFGALAALLAIPLLRLRAPETPLRRVDMMDGYVMVDDHDLVHRFVSLRPEAPYWSKEFTGRRPELWWSGLRQHPDDCPYTLVYTADPDRFLFEARLGEEANRSIRLSDIMITVPSVGDYYRTYTTIEGSTDGTEWFPLQGGL